MSSHQEEQVMLQDGEMAARLRGFDWSRTPLGPIADWPLGLRAALRTILDAPQAMSLWWGPEFRWLYNDAFVPLLGERHPGALGQPAEHAWPQIWSSAGRQAVIALEERRATWTEEQLFTFERDGRLEETYFGCAHTPVADDSGEPAGVLCVALDRTARVLEQRRERSLRLLEEALALAGPLGGYEAAAQALSKNPADLPFTLLYRLDDDGKARLAARTFLAQGPPLVDLHDAAAPLPLRAVLDSRRATEVAAPRPAVVLPLAVPGGARVGGFMVAGVNPRLPFTGDYRRYLVRLAECIAAVVVSPSVARARVAFYGCAPSPESEAPSLTRLVVQTQLRIARTHASMLDSERAKVRALGARLVTTEANNRAQLAQALHERLQPLLVAAKIRLSLARHQGGAELERAAALIDEAFAASRALLYELAPAPPSAASLRGSLESLADWCRSYHALQVDLQVQESLPEPAPECSAFLWNAVRELLLNTVKHSGTGAASVQVVADANELVVTVSDAGRGFEPAMLVEGFGLLSIRGKLAGFGGTLSIDAAPGVGARFTVRVPFEPGQDRGRAPK